METSRCCLRESRAAVTPSLRQQRQVSCQATSTSQPRQQQQQQACSWCDRRALLSTAAGLAVLTQLQPAEAVQGLTAGRLPGLKGPDASGLFTYTRPEGKSGGLGVGWTEIPRYSFKVPPGWGETPVSIADLGGTEIDLRFGNKEMGSLQVVVAPVMRFMDEEPKGGVKIEDIGDPDKIIQGFHPEIFGAPMRDEDLVSTNTTKGPDGLTYYQWELKPHNLLAATAYGNRLIIMALKANAIQWRKSGPQLRNIQSSFMLPDVKA